MKTENILPANKDMVREYLLFTLDEYSKVVSHKGCGLWTDTMEGDLAKTDELHRKVRIAFDIMSESDDIPQMDKDDADFLNFAMDQYISANIGSLWCEDAEHEQLYASVVLDMLCKRAPHKVHFDTSFKVAVSAAAIIEDCQALMRAAQEPLNYEQVDTTAMCLAELLSNCLVTKDVTRTCKVIPSSSSIVTMCASDGILCCDDGTDIPCAAWKPVSLALAGGVCQCPDTCPYRAENCGEPCDPERMRIKLFNGFMYDGTNGEELLHMLQWEHK